jgi:hypothetical protein
MRSTFSSSLYENRETIPEGRLEAMEDTQPPPTTTPAPGGSDAKYLLVVAGLMMTIVILLSVLWIRERRNGAILRGELEIARRGAMRGNLQGALANMLAVQADPQSRALQRDDLPAQTVTWNGQPRTVLSVSAAAGQRMGLRPGDVIVVAPPPATEPATQPTTRPGG